MDALEIIAVALGALTFLTVVPGLVLFVWGAVLVGASTAVEKSVAFGTDATDVASKIADEFGKILKRLFGILFGTKERPRGQKLMAAGAFLVLLGFMFFIATLGVLVAALATDGDSSGGATTTTAPTTTG